MSHRAWIALDDCLAAGIAELADACTAADTCLRALEHGGQRPDAPTYRALMAISAHLLALRDCRRQVSPYLAHALDALDPPCMDSAREEQPCNAGLEPGF